MGMKRKLRTEGMLGSIYQNPSTNHCKVSVLPNLVIDKKLYLVNSSDSNAYIEFSLLYEPIEETYPLEMSMNLSQVSMPASETYESELKATSKTEIDSMNDHLNTLEGREAGLGDIVSKFELLSREIKKKIADKNTQVKERKISYSEKYVGGEIP